MSDKGFLQRTKDFFTGADLYYPTNTYDSVPLKRASTGSVGSAGVSNVTPPPRSERPALTVEAAMGMSAVYRAVSIIATTVSQLEVGVYRGGSELKTVPATVTKPDLAISGSKFLKRTVMSMATSGNFFWRLQRDSAGTVMNIEVLNPNAMSIGYDKNGKKFYQYGNTKFNTTDIYHGVLTEMPGSDWGIGPIQACRAELEGAVDVSEYGNKFFRENGIPTGVLSTKDYIDGDTAAEYQNRLNLMVNRPGGGRQAVLGNGMTYTPMMFSPEDAQFLQSQEFSVTQVARMFGIPANYLLAEVPGGTMTYQNMQDVDTAFVRYTLMEYLREIEEAFTTILPRGQKARFKTEGLLRSELKVRYDAYKVAVEAGWLTVEEVRELEGLQPLPEGTNPPANPKAVEGGTP